MSIRRRFAPVQLIRRRLDRVVFGSDAEFREAYFKAVPEAVEFTLVGRLT